MDINPRERQGQAMAIWGAGIMVAPIIGPTLGAWLTDNFDWRWVFYINLPVGILAFVGMLFFMPETPRRIRRFDFFGFAMLSLAVGSFQFMLDRGAELDWFKSAEILIELGLAIAAAWVFVVHTVTDREPFLETALFRDRNFAASLVFIFVIGIILLATMALLPPMLQKLFGYPVVTVGLVLAPRGIGTMISMLVVGRLVRLVDPRLLVLFGLLLTALSLWQMTGFSPEMDEWPLIISGVIQGFGLGFVFIPLSTVAFTTLDAAVPHRRDQPLQPDPQSRLDDRHLDHGRDADIQHPDAPRDADRRAHPLQRPPDRCRHRPDDPRHPGRAPDRGAARRHDQRPGADDRLSRRLQADVHHHALRRAAASLAPLPEARTRRGRRAVRRQRRWPTDAGRAAACPRQSSGTKSGLKTTSQRCSSGSWK